jgi:hypothetical protein
MAPRSVVIEMYDDDFDTTDPLAENTARSDELRREHEAGIEASNDLFTRKIESCK